MCAHPQQQSPSHAEQGLDHALPARPSRCLQYSLLDALFHEHTPCCVLPAVPHALPAAPANAHRTYSLPAWLKRPRASSPTCTFFFTICSRKLEAHQVCIVRRPACDNALAACRRLPGAACCGHGSDLHSPSTLRMFAQTRHTARRTTHNHAKPSDDTHLHHIFVLKLV